MFDSLALENPKRKWATMMSFTLETALVGMLIATPLAFTEKLQLGRLGDQIVAPISMSIDTTPPTTEPEPPNTNRSELNSDDSLIAPMVIPTEIHQFVDKQPVAPPGVGEYIPGAIPGVGQTNSTMKTLFDSIRPHVAAAAPTVTHGPLVISHLDAGFLIHRVQPVYPHNAIITRTEGTVVLAALIDTTGHITQLHAISGHPLLIPAAIDAVRQWRYKPYILNNSPVEVETQVSVNFTLNH